MRGQPKAVSRDVCFTSTDVALRFRDHFAPPAVKLSKKIPEPNAEPLQAARLAVSLALQFVAFAGAVNKTAPASMVLDSKARRRHAGRGESGDELVFMNSSDIEREVCRERLLGSNRATVKGVGAALAGRPSRRCAQRLRGKFGRTLMHGQHIAARRAAMDYRIPVSWKFFRRVFGVADLRTQSGAVTDGNCHANVACTVIFR
jgi:hypothetical protein